MAVSIRLVSLLTTKQGRIHPAFIQNSTEMQGCIHPVFIQGLQRCMDAPVWHSFSDASIQQGCTHPAFSKGFDKERVEKRVETRTEGRTQRSPWESKATASQ
eukprot:1147121-Pelagomonas_calceolata.AAC.7